ncbi:MAG: hypothetical protein ACXV2C_04560 [Candidatus Bathyarchaeia archaeon]
MTKLIVSLFLQCTIAVACGKTQIRKETGSKKSEHLLYDTSRIVILPIDRSNPRVFEDAISTQLTNRDLQTINKLLQDCINTQNDKQDTTKEFSEYIDLRKYKIQYIPFLDQKGDKKVYINCFCASDWGFEYWKQALVEVDDGGSCFFHLTINLTQKKYEQLFTNGYG